MDLPILQSGYVGVCDSSLTPGKVDKEKMEEIRALVNNSFYVTKDNPYFYDPEIETLFSSYLNDGNKLKNFEFRESILKKAKYSFGNTTLKDFILKQAYSPYLSNMHVKFIIDTLRYINTGKRNIVIFSWEPLIRIKNNHGKNSSEELIIYLEKGYSSDGLNRLYLDGPLVETISKWTSEFNGLTNNGFYDLLYTLKIIFGKKIEKVTV